MERRKLLLSLLSQSRLPKEYKAVEYIESTGTQWIDTGILTNSAITFNLEIKQTDMGNSKIIGSRVSAYSKAFALYFNNSNIFTFNYFETINEVSDATIFNNRKLSIKGLNKNGYYLIIVNNESIFSPNYKQDELFNGNLYLMTYNNNGNPTIPNTVTNLILYSCKIYNNDILVRNFIPCYLKSTGEAGLYDTVSKQFFTNQGTGVFKYPRKKWHS